MGPTCELTHPLADAGGRPNRAFVGRLARVQAPACEYTQAAPTHAQLLHSTANSRAECRAHLAQGWDALREMQRLSRTDSWAVLCVERRDAWHEALSEVYRSTLRCVDEASEPWSSLVWEHGSHPWFMVPGSVARAAA